jgi:hypothetical protein
MGAGLEAVEARIDREFGGHNIRVMKPRFRTITVALEEEIARWARIEAARSETSVSNLLGAILKERMLHNDGYERAMRRVLARKAFPKAVGRCLSRWRPTTAPVFADTYVFLTNPHPCPANKFRSGSEFERGCLPQFTPRYTP